MQRVESPDITPRTMEIEQRNDRVGDLIIHAEVAGTGPSLLLLHGLAGSTRWWAKNVRCLAEQFRVYAIDLIGFGGSRRRRQRFELADAAGHLARWLDHIGIDRASVVGHSLGGYIASEFAADYGGRVDRLVLVDAAALPLAQRRLHATFSLVRAIRHTPLSFFPVLLREATRTGPVTVWNAAGQLLAADISHKLPLIDAPTLVVWGSNDTVVPPNVGEQLSKIIPNATVMLIKAAGHNPMWDQPDAFNRILLDFLSPSEGA